MEAAQGDAPLGQVSAPPYSIEYRPEISLEYKVFSSKFDFGDYLAQIFKPADRTKLAGDAGVWNWLSMVFFELICPKRPDGSRKLLAREKYIFDSRARRYYRHLVAAPYLLVDQYGGTARVLLDSRPSVHGDFVEQIVSRPEIASNRELMKAIHSLYFDPVNGRRVKRGATDRDQPGTLRRLIAVQQQFALTYDLQAMSMREILDLLPDEFGPWKSQMRHRPPVTDTRETPSLQTTEAVKHPSA